METGLSRRSFVKKLGAAGLGLAIAADELTAKAVDSLQVAGRNIRNFKPGMKYREVGKTGVVISAFSIGTTRGELEAINAGIDKGVNFIHTSVAYMNGRGIEMVAQAIKGRTDKVHIGLKDNFESLEEISRSWAFHRLTLCSLPGPTRMRLRRNSRNCERSSWNGAKRAWSNLQALRSTRTWPSASTLRRGLISSRVSCRATVRCR